VRRLLIVALSVGVIATGCSEPARGPMLPPMGWNSWNSGMALTEQTVEQTIDAMVSSGLRDAGYRYVNLDAGWAAPTRDDDGKLQADPQRFPNGIAAVARYAHDRNMYLGIYHSPFNQGCGQDPRIGGAGHERADAQSFADWGVDYLKYDWCRADASHELQVHYFSAMRDALRATGRHIFYSVNPNSSDDAEAGARYDWSTIADMNRNSVDLVPTWGDNTLWSHGLAGVLQGAGVSIPLAHKSSPAHINDPDMMVIGVGWNDFVRTHPTMTLGPTQPDLDDTEQRSHFSLWAMLAAPLLAGNDVRSMSPQTLTILTNRDIIAVDQDPLVAQGHPLESDPRVWVKPLADGAVAVALTNTSGTPGGVATTAAAVGLPRSDCYRVRDLWAHTDSDSSGSVGPATVPAHGVAMFRVSTCG
jgi:alpha-galactosidase